MSLSKILFIVAKSPLGELIAGIAFATFSKLLPVERVKETDRVIAFKHPKPHWEQHILLVPKKAIRNLTSATAEDFEYIKEIFVVAAQIAKENNWDKGNYSIITNGGHRQEVAQLHFHLASGKTL